MRIERASTAYPFIVVSEVDEKAGVGEDAAPVVASDHRGVFVLIDHEWGQKVGAPGREDLDEQTVSRFDEEDARRLRDALIALGRELGWPEGGAT